MRRCCWAGPIPTPRLAVAVYLHSLTAGIAAMTAALGGLDALVFTGGVGEHAPALRSPRGVRLGYLGVAVDEQRNAAARLAGPADPDVDISAADAVVRTLVVRSREDLQIAAGVEQALGDLASAPRA